MPESNAAERIRVLIVDDDARFAELEAIVLADDPRIDVAGIARTGAEGVAWATRLAPHVVLMDVSMPVLDGIEATRRICARLPNVRVVVVTGSSSRADVDAARRAGAAAYVPKERIGSELVKVVCEVAATLATSLGRGMSHVRPGADERPGPFPLDTTAWLSIPA